MLFMRLPGFHHLSIVSKVSIVSLFVLMVGAGIGLNLSNQQQEVRSRASTSTNVCSSVTTQACSYTNSCSAYANGTLCEKGVNGCGTSTSGNNVYICQSGKWVYQYWTKSGTCNFCAVSTPTITLKPTAVITATPTPTVRPTSMPIATLTPTHAPTPTPTPTPIVIPSPTPTRIPTLTLFPTLTPTNVPSPTPTQSAPTSTPALLATNTPVPPTNTIAPTASPVPGGTVLAFAIRFHGLGTGGDSANPQGTGNMTPLRPDRVISTDIYDNQNILVMSKQGNFIYDQTSGTFKGTIDLGTGFTSGAYSVKVKADQYLRILVPGIQNLTVGQTNNLPTFAMVTGDINNDNQINILDYNILMGCYSDLLPAVSCSSGDALLADLNDDGNVNQFDYNLFLRELGNISGQ